jgi:hypothetical protein
MCLRIKIGNDSQEENNSLFLVFTMLFWRMESKDGLLKVIMFILSFGCNVTILDISDAVDGMEVSDYSVQHCLTDLEVKSLNSETSSSSQLSSPSLEITGEKKTKKNL